jgi:uncharacterized membrane protein YhaH (DUF805 family)
MNHFIDAMRKYVDFGGRATRSQYWWFLLIATVISIALSIVDAQLGTTVDSSAAVDSGLLSGLFSLAIFLPSLAVTVRRLHDTGRSGWWILVLLIPCVGLIFWLVFALSGSEPRDNRWGPYVWGPR